MNINAIYNFQPGLVNHAVSKMNPYDTDAIASVKNEAPFNFDLNDSPVTPVSHTSKASNNPKEKNTENSEDNEKQAHSEKPLINGQQLTPAEMQLVEELKQADTKVRQHEAAHIAAGGKYITTGANFTYQRGPDGINYVVGGEVGIDTSPVPGDPSATLQKMRQVKQAALAPADPSPQDLKVASKAGSAASKALSDLMISQAKEQAASNEENAFSTLKKATDSYEMVNNLPEKETTSFTVAV